MDEFTARVLTCMIEAPVAYTFIKHEGWTCRGPGHAAMAAVVGTCVLHPPAWDAFKYLDHTLGWGFWPSFLLVEACVYVSKALLIGWMIMLPFKRAMILSTLENTASAGFGLVLMTIGLG
jgi:hypothetical protein